MISRTRVTLGAHSQKTRENEKQIFKIKRKIPHPFYSRITRGNDIMLLQLNRNANLNKAVALHRLPSRSDDVKEGTTCEVAGWGITRNGESNGSDTLMAVNITIISREKCNTMKLYRNKYFISKNMLCAGDKKGRKDTCKGDSGGPLICHGELSGVTSFGPEECGKTGAAGVYTRLSEEYLQWIKETIGGDS